MLIRKYWFYTFTFLHVLFDLGALLYAVSLSLTRYNPYSGLPIDLRTFLVVQDLFLCLGILNGVYLLTHGYLRTNTILGSFLFQQILITVLVALALGILIERWYDATGYFHYNPWGDDLVIFFVSFTLHVLSSSTLWYLFSTARRAKDDLLGCWTVDVGDLAMGARVPSDGPRWRGAKRPSINKDSYRRRIIKVIAAFIPNALFRRVPEVETMPYAFFQHSLALAAMALLLTRAATLLTQLGNENLPSRTVVDVCLSENEGYRFISLSVIVRHPELTGVDNALNPESVDLRHNVSIEYQSDERTSWSGSVIGLKPCTPVELQKADPDANGANVTDWFYIFHCGEHAQSSQWPSSTGYMKYSISSNQTDAGNIDIFDEQLPNLWLASDYLRNYTLTPYAVPPIRPIFQTNAYFETRLALRKFISSSPIRDAVTGSKPEYDTFSLYPWSQTYSQPMSPYNGSNTAPHTTGRIRLPGYVDSSLQTPGSMLKERVRGPENLCEIIEEYRTGSSFDILASIGGLLALLQGLHIFLFGRPLFWGLFGAKIITPFGIFGRLATKDFRERLKNRYDPDSLSNQEREAIKQEAILMTRFLLDYVVDLGPAEWPAKAQTQTPEQRDLLGEPSNMSSATAQSSHEQEGRQTP